jgi:hypothetical protein
MNMDKYWAYILLHFWTIYIERVARMSNVSNDMTPRQRQKPRHSGVKTAQAQTVAPRGRFYIIIKLITSTLRRKQLMRNALWEKPLQQADDSGSLTLTMKICDA